MPAVVGGWLTVKKRGEDDELIERDRQIALQRRRDELIAKREREREHRRRRTQLQPQTQQHPEPESESDAEPVVSPSTERWGPKRDAERDDCGGRKRKRKRNQGFTQRELFPYVTPRTSRNKFRRDHEKHHPVERGKHSSKGVDNNECEYRTRNQQLPLKRSPHTREVRKRNRIVTPDNIAKDSGYNEKNEAEASFVHHHRHDNPGNPKALFAKPGPLPRSKRTEDVVGCNTKEYRQRGRRHDHKSMHKKQNQTVRTIQPSLQIDFARSAKLLSETIQRNKLTRHDRQEPTITFKNCSISWRRSSAIDRRRTLDPKSIIFRCLHGTSIGAARASKARNKAQAVRSLDTNSSTRTYNGNNGNNGNNGKWTASLHMPDKLDATATKPVETRSSATIKEEPNRSNVRNQTQQLTTQGEDSNAKQPDRAGQGIAKRRRSESPPIRSKFEHNHNDQKESQKLSVNHTGIILRNLDKNDDDYYDYDDRPESPSVSSSAMLSLPMNASCSSAFLSPSDGDGDGDCWDTDCNNHDAARNSTETSRKSPASVERDDDPLIDSDCWTRIRDREQQGESNKSGGGPPTFRHALASIVLAKNSAEAKGQRSGNGNGSGRYRDDGGCNHAGGMLWLPSILEGGTNRIGLLFDGSRGPTGSSLQSRYSKSDYCL
eukprot:jgi/Psemu1/282506/fgenesh1_pg.8_\